MITMNTNPYESIFHNYIYSERDSRYTVATAFQPRRVRSSIA